MSESKSEQTKLRIMHSYISLMESKRWDKITVKEICLHANTTRGTFYQYYFDIYDLMEQIQTMLIDDINQRYEQAKQEKNTRYPIEMFEDQFDYTPPELLKAWFKFCKKYKKEIYILLNPKYGDTYFVKKLKVILSKNINEMMDDDGLPNDELRKHFTKLIIEMHFLAARSWLEPESKEHLSITEIINLLNTMRVGASYLEYRSTTTPDFDIKMKITED